MPNYANLDWQTPANPSSQVHSMAHDGDRLYVRFHGRDAANGKPAKPSAVYAYPKATAEHMTNLLNAESTGSAFIKWKNTEHGQTYERLDNWQDEPTPATGTTFSTHPDKLTD